MKGKIKISSPCSQDWDNMGQVTGGRFCDACEKKVWDFDHLSNAEIDEVLKSNPAVCGKKSILKPTFSSVFLALTLTSAIYVNAQTEHKSTTENIYQKSITINGKLTSSKNVKLASGEISLVTLDKIYHAKADEAGNFNLSFPEKALTEHNVIRIDYTTIDSSNREFTDSNSSILKTNELLGKQNFEIEQKYVTIGGVYISDHQPPDYYFLDGRQIGKRKFEKIKKEHPDYKYLAFYDEVIVKELTRKNFIENLYLLYSK